MAGCGHGGTEAGCGRPSLHAHGWWLKQHCNGDGTGPGHGHARGRLGSTGAGREQGEGTAGAHGWPGLEQGG